MSVCLCVCLHDNSIIINEIHAVIIWYLLCLYQTMKIAQTIKYEARAYA